MINPNWVSAWSAVLTVTCAVGFFLYGRWSKRQDKAILEMQTRLKIIRTQTIELRRYIRELLHIMGKNNINYPEPPDSFYESSVYDPYSSSVQTKDNNNG